MDIAIIGAEITDEHGLGACYRITQRTPHGIELYVLPRSAVVEDMELHGVDDPLHVLDWRLHGYRGTPHPPSHIPPSLRTAITARTIATTARPDAPTTRADDQARTKVDELKARARRERDAETAAIKETDRVVDDAGYSALRALIVADTPNIETDREHYRGAVITHPVPGETA